MEGLAINALLVQLYQPELLSTGPAAKVGSVRGSALIAAPGLLHQAPMRRHPGSEEGEWPSRGPIDFGGQSLLWQKMTGGQGQRPYPHWHC
jgi:hypothetical protein